MPTDSHTADLRERVDVELPLGGAQPVDIDLGTAAAQPPGGEFRPTLSQAAGQLPRSRVRWPGRSRSGFRDTDCWNWMRDGRAGFGERTVGGR